MVALTSPDFKRRADRAMADPRLQTALRRGGSGFHSKRAQAVAALPEFEQLRDIGRDIKNHALANLDHYLEVFERNVIANGGQVHWCADAAEARDAVLRICQEADARTVTKGKSMISEEIGVNEHLSAHGIVPVDGEPVGTPEVYDRDRLFAYLRAPDADPAQDAAVAALAAAGHPVVRLDVKEPGQLGQVFFLWEFATAVAGAVIGINPFDQPDVEASKIETRKLTDAHAASGALPEETPFLEEDGLKLFADAGNLLGLPRQGLDAVIAAHLQRAGSGDYVALLAYVERNPAHREALGRMRTAIRDGRRVATCAEFGPRFLHSTGQAYKGGPGSGVFLQITADPAHDLAVPGQPYSFGVVEAAQARGDLDVLAERGRRALRVHLGPDVEAGLARLARAVEAGVK